MRDNTNALGLMNELKQSALFGERYSEFLNFEGTYSASSYFVKNMSEYLNKILMDCNGVNDFQIEILHKIFAAFNDIQIKIDPNRMVFEYAFNGDDELVLFRNTDRGLINIIINPEECFAFSIIPKSLTHQKSLTFYDEHFSDFEGLAYKFFS